MATTATRRRRGRGEGSLFYDQTRGEWVGIVDLGRDHRGRRHRKTVRATNKATAAEKLRAVQTDRDRGLPAADGSLTVAGWCSWWLDNIVAGGVSAMTVKQYRSRLEQWVFPYVGRVALTKLRPEQVQAMMANLADAGLSPRSVRQARGVLASALKQAEAWGKVPRNAAALTKAPSTAGTKLNDALDETDAAKVLAAAAGDRLEALAVVVLSTGLRQGEALALRWEDIDLDGATVTVTKSKTPAGLRTIALPGFAVTALRAHRRAQLGEGRSPMVFTGTAGKALSASSAYRWWQDLCQRAGVGRRRFHASRHTAATLMLNNGVAHEVVSATLGHAGLAITADVYAKVRPELQRSAATAMQNVLGTGGGR
jgi:integrase